jgi:hypothetical protein
MLEIVAKQFRMLRRILYYQIATFEMQEKCCKMRDGKIVNTAFRGRVEPLKDIFRMPSQYLLQSTVLMRVSHWYLFIITEKVEPKRRGGELLPN